MRILARAVIAIGAFNTLLGRVFSWFALGIVLVCFTGVVLRYVFGISFVWIQDIYVWMNGMMFTGMAGYVLLRNGHVRVDIFYRVASLRRKALVDLAGTVLLLAPFVATVAIWSWHYVASAWRFHESSLNMGGLPGLYVVKSFILVFAGVVALQGIALASRAILVLAGREDLLPEPLRYGQGG